MKKGTCIVDCEGKIRTYARNGCEIMNMLIFDDLLNKMCKIVFIVECILLQKQGRSLFYFPCLSKF